MKRECENNAEAQGRGKKNKSNAIVEAGAIYISSDEEEEDGRTHEIQIQEDNNNSVDRSDRLDVKTSRTIYSKGKNSKEGVKSLPAETINSEYEKYDWETSSKKDPNIDENKDPSTSSTSAETLNKHLAVASRKRLTVSLRPGTNPANEVHYKLLTSDQIWMKFMHLAGMTVQVRDKKRGMKGMTGNNSLVIFEKMKFNPYEATAQNVADFLFYMERTEDLDLESDDARVLLSGIARYLPNLNLVKSPGSGDSTLFNLSNFSPSFLVRESHESVLSRLNPLKLNPGIGNGNCGKSPKQIQSTYQLFRQHCEYYFQADPILANPEIVVDFLLHLLKDKVKKNTSNHLVPFNNFYTENIRSICINFDTFLKCSLSSSVLESAEVKDLLAVAEAADENSICNDAAMKLYPDHHYAKKRLKLKHEESFWNGSLLKKVVFDIKFNKSLDVYTAAKELGVTSEMLYHRIMSESTEECEEADDFEHIPSLCEFLKKTNSSPKMFWKEVRVKELLDDVKSREKTVADVAALFGVGRKEIIQRCGKIKTEDEIMESIKEEKIKKVLEKEEQDKMKKKVTMLDKQIMFAEENEDTLCDYELARLANMRERKELMAKLNFEEDKNELRKIAKVAKVERIANSPDAEQLQKRGKSVRVQRKMEADRLKHGDGVSVQPGRGGRCEKRITPKWFGETVPDTSKLQLEKLVKATPVPKFDLIAPQLLEMTSDYRRSAIFLDSVSCEAKDLAHKKEAKFKMNEEDWIQFEAEEETIVSTSRVTSLDSFNDFFCYGTEAGGVGVVLAGNTVSAQHCTFALLLSLSLPRPQRDHQTSQRRGDRSGDGGAEDHVHQHGRHGQVGAGTVIFVTYIVAEW